MATALGNCITTLGSLQRDLQNALHNVELAARQAERARQTIIGVLGGSSVKSNDLEIAVDNIDGLKEPIRELIHQVNLSMTEVAGIGTL